MSASVEQPGPLRHLFSTLPALLLLVFVVVQGSSEAVHGRLLTLGEAVWTDYATVRAVPTAPTCGAAEAAAAPAATDPLDAMFDEAAEEEEAPADPLDAMFDEAAEEDAPADPLDAMFDEAAEEEAPADPLDAMFDEAGVGGTDDDAAAAAAEAKRKAAERCEQEHEAYAAIVDVQTPALAAYASFEGSVGTLSLAGQDATRLGLIFLVLICATTASATRAHIALRAPGNTRQARVADVSQVLANLVLIYSSLEHASVLARDGATEAMMLPYAWAAGFAAMTAASVRNVVRGTPGEDDTVKNDLIGGMLATPLYVGMTYLSAVWFLGLEGHPSGLAIYLDKLVEHAPLYLQVGLYVWAGMLLKQTAVAARSFDVLRPFALPPEALAIVVVLLSALPTAYSGASGIFVIAAGAVVYRELRRSGARNQLALAATALSGSLGVVLAPCLLVVIVASLNNDVTTTELFGAGRWVFALSAGLFVVVVWLTRTNPFTWRGQQPDAANLRPELGAAVRALAPYLAVCALVLGIYAIGLDVWLDEHSASKVLPVMLLALVVFESWRGRRTTSASEAPAPEGTGRRLLSATAETTLHIGALLTLMSLSVGLGGVIERAEVMSLVPPDLGSPLITMGLLTVLLVGVGMVMDPYGAVILVSATLVDVARDNGISALHFWMVVLVAFELGYLTPPVALNHLLTRAVVGPDAMAVDPDAPTSLWYRYERLLLPITVMGITLLIVAFGPLLVA